MGRKEDKTKLAANANAAYGKGKFKKALKMFVQLEQLDEKEPRYSKRVGDVQRRLGKINEAVSAYSRAVDRYRNAGFLVKAITTCRLVIQIMPDYEPIREQLRMLNEERGFPSEKSKTQAASPKAPMPQEVPPPAESAAPEKQPAQYQRPAGRKQSGILEAVASPTRAKAVAESSIGIEPEQSVVIEPEPLPEVAPSIVIEPEPNRVFESQHAPEPSVVIASQAEPEPQSSVEVDPEATHEWAASPGSVVKATPRSLSGRGKARKASVSTGAAASSFSELNISEILAAAEEEPSIDLNDSIIEIPLSDAEFDQMMAEIGMEGDADRETLKSNELFVGLSEDELESLINSSEIVELDDGEVLFSQGDPGDSLYVLTEGQVVVVSEGEPRVELARLQEGAFLGEVALLTNEPRTATVVSAGESELLRLPTTVLLDLSNRNDQLLQTLLRFVRDRMTARLMTVSPLFAQFPESQRGEIVRLFRCIDVEDNVELIVEGTEARGLFLVLCGTLGVSRHGHHEPIAKLGSGDICGEISLIEDTPATATVRTDGRALLLEMPAQAFRETVMMHPQVLMYVSQLAAERKAKLLDIDNISLV